MAGEAKLKGIDALREEQKTKTEPADAAKALAAPKRVLLLSVAPSYHIAKVARFERHKAYVQPDQVARIRQISGCGQDFFVASDIRALPEKDRHGKIAGLARRFILAGALTRETPPFTEGELMQALGYRFVAADAE
jgi:hypothetical protein